MSLTYKFSWLKWNNNKLMRMNKTKKIDKIQNTSDTEWSRYQTQFVSWESNIYHVWLSVHTPLTWFQVTHESIFIYEHNGWSQSNEVKSSLTNQYSSMQYDHWLLLPLTMMINCKLKLVPSKKGNHITFYITKISICICIEI